MNAKEIFSKLLNPISIKALLVNILSLRLKRKFMRVATRPVALQEGEEPWLVRKYTIYNGISFAPVDIIKGISFGLASYGICRLADINIKDAMDGFLKGFALGGVIGGLEDISDSTIGTLLNYPLGGLPPGWESIVHELFQSMLMQGIISGAIVAGISALGK